MSSSSATPPSSSSPTVPENSEIKEEVPSTSSPPSSDESPPSPPSESTTPPPPTESTPPPSPPDPPSPTAATPPPPSDPPPSPTPSPPTSPPPAPPTSSSPPPPASTPPPSSPPPSTPAESPPPPASSASPPPPTQSSPSPPSVIPSTPPPADEAAPAQNPPPQAAAADSPPLAVAYPPPQPKATAAGTTPAPLSLSPNAPRSASAARPTASSPPTTPSSSQDGPNINPGVIVGIVFGGVVIILLLAVIICLMCTRRKRKPNYYPNGGNQYYNQEPAQWQHDPNAKLHPPAGSFMGAAVGGYGSGEFSTGGYSGQHPPVVAVPPSQNMGGGMMQFSYEDLVAATNGFSQSNLLGQGGFGLVHKGILSDGREVAVKSLKSGSGQGEREFQAEVEIISRVHHRHLVSLVGYCIANDKKILVYEFVANKTLEFHLYGKDQPVIDWPTRLRIAIGSAKGLAYLHEDCLPRIIHRDIKAANILIDNNYEAMVADFGLAKLTTDNNTHVSTRVMGTFGYLAPEYASSGKLSEKSDVFSFGVMLLELITGRRPIDMSNMMEDSLVDWARPLLTKALEDGNFDELVDPRLEGKYAHLELSHMAACAAASIRHSARKRPKMSQIVRALEGDSSLDDLNEGVKPGQSAVYNPNGGTQVYDTRAYNADMLKFKKMVMASGEFNSSEYGTTSEYGLNPSVSSDSTADSREMDKTRIDINKN